MRGHLVRDTVEVDALDHPGEAEGVVAVEVGDADPVQVVRGDPGPQHLPLGALTGVEEQALPVPAQQIAVVVAVPGRDLAGGAEDHQFTYGQGRLPRRPLHATAAQEVGVRVEDGLARAAARVEHDAVALQLLLGRHLAGLAQQVRGDDGLGGGEEATSGWCTLGMTRMCVGAWGFMSRKATVVSVSRTTFAGTCPATILQNRQSSCGSPVMRVPPHAV